MPMPWTRESILDLVRGYQPACVLAAAADLDLFRAFAGRGSMTADAVAAAIGADARGTTVLLDALAALGLIDKDGEAFSVPPAVGAALGGTGPGSILAMAQHQASCLRRWALLAQVVKSGRRADAPPGVRGGAGDRESFILAMNDVSAASADGVIRHVGDLDYRCVLDVGGGSGTWTLAFLRACPSARAILFDLPLVVPMARQRFEDAGVVDRVTLVAGDFNTDPLPAGADLAWVSAIVHQNSREQNRALFGRVAAALAPGGVIAIRDHLMEPSRTAPVAGALFAVNMLVGTEGGGTYTVDELREDLEAAGLHDVAVAHREPTMNSILVARRRG